MFGIERRVLYDSRTNKTREFGKQACFILR